MTNKVFRYYLPPSKKGLFYGCIMVQVFFIFLLFVIIYTSRMSLAHVADYIALVFLLIMIGIFGLGAKFSLRMMKANKKFSYIVLEDQSFVFPYDPEQSISQTIIYYHHITLVEERIVGFLKKTAYIYIETNDNIKLEITKERMKEAEYNYLLDYLKSTNLSRR